MLAIVLTVALVVTAPWWIFAYLFVIGPILNQKTLASGELAGASVWVRARCSWGCDYAVRARPAGLLRRGHGIAGLDCSWDEWHAGTPFNEEGLEFIAFEELDELALVSRSDPDRRSFMGRKLAPGLTYLALYDVEEGNPRLIEVLSAGQLDELGRGGIHGKPGLVSSYDCVDFYHARDDAIRARLIEAGATP